MGWRLKARKGGISLNRLHNNKTASSDIKASKFPPVNLYNNIALINHTLIIMTGCWGIPKQKLQCEFIVQIIFICAMVDGRYIHRGEAAAVHGQWTCNIMSQLWTCDGLKIIQQCIEIKLENVKSRRDYWPTATINYTDGEIIFAKIKDAQNVFKQSLAFEKPTLWKWMQRLWLIFIKFGILNNTTVLSAIYIQIGSE